MGDRGGGAVLQLLRRADLGAGWGAERGVQVQSGQAVCMEPELTGRYKVASGGGQRWWGGIRLGRRTKEKGYR